MGITWDGSGIPTALVGAGCYNKYHRCSSLNKRHLFSQSSGTGESKIKVLATLTSAESLLPCSQMASFSPYPHMAERRSTGVSSSPYKGTYCITGGFTLMTSAKPDHLPTTHLLIPSHWRLGLQHRNLGEGETETFSPYGHSSIRDSLSAYHGPALCQSPKAEGTMDQGILSSLGFEHK